MDNDGSSTSLLGKNKRLGSASGPGRFHFSVCSVFFLVLLLVTVISLGTFEVIQRRITNLEPNNSQQCILFARYAGMKDGYTVLRLSALGVCGFTLWGQVSLVLVAFVWLVYSITQAVLGSRVISVMRVLDFLVMLLSFFLSFSLSVTLTAGLNKTCSAFPRYTCQNSVLVSPHDGNDKKVYYYNDLQNSKSSSWAATVMLIVLNIWNLLLVIIYCTCLKRRRRERQLAKLQGGEHRTISDETPSSDAEELDDVSKERPFAST